ncbi:hypothetical protein BDK51DRAFT_44921 [Blyttiomyces helicus]|uniref:Uncharacterized protein n=1 Tax=Blyttiomyces helicus TaxID=388810 RepID=A0A4P9WF77_9FUNG|nr:hypothetical protein BDK51DRAFT_44921 [Blyttiomyces helicus]|eukprot:RKO90485.1 hypothetical protein BDK51DRAFT_44921 [Blyttiomyces helicus]
MGAEVQACDRKELALVKLNDSVSFDAFLDILIADPTQACKTPLEFHLSAGARACRALLGERGVLPSSSPTTLKTVAPKMSGLFPVSSLNGQSSDGLPGWDLAIADDPPDANLTVFLNVIVRTVIEGGLFSPMVLMPSFTPLVSLALGTLQRRIALLDGLGALPTPSFNPARPNASSGRRSPLQSPARLMVRGSVIPPMIREEVQRDDLEVADPGCVDVNAQSQRVFRLKCKGASHAHLLFKLPPCAPPVHVEGARRAGHNGAAKVFPRCTPTQRLDKTAIEPLLPKSFSQRSPPLRAGGPDFGLYRMNEPGMPAHKTMTVYLIRLIYAVRVGSGARGEERPGQYSKPEYANLYGTSINKGGFAVAGLTWANKNYEANARPAIGAGADELGLSVDGLAEADALVFDNVELRRRQRESG